MYWTCSLFRSARGCALPAVQRGRADTAGGRGDGRWWQSAGPGPFSTRVTRPVLRMPLRTGTRWPPAPFPHGGSTAPSAALYNLGEGGRRASSCDWLTNLPSSPPPARAGTIYLFWLAPRRGCVSPANGRPAEGGNGGDAGVALRLRSVEARVPSPY